MRKDIVMHVSSCYDQPFHLGVSSLWVQLFTCRGRSGVPSVPTIALAFYCNKPPRVSPRALTLTRKYLLYMHICTSINLPAMSAPQAVTILYT